MKEERSGLGKGLGSLITQLRREHDGEYKVVRLDEIKPNPHQPRKTFDPMALQELVESIRSVGIIQPLILRPAEDGYQLIAGERRWMAAIKAGLKEVPAILRSVECAEMQEMALIENIQRVDLNAIEEGNAYQQIIADQGISQSELARKLGKSRSDIANTIRLLKLPPAVKKMIFDGSLTEGHARTLLVLEGDDGRLISLAEKAVGQGLSVRELERLTKGRRKEANAVSRETVQPTIEEDLMERLYELAAMKPTLRRSGKHYTLKLRLKDRKSLLKAIDALKEL